MQISNSTQNQYCNFTARTPQIKDAEWVSHIVNSTFPHFSTTKHQLGLISYFSKDKNFAPPKNILEIYDRLSSNPHIKTHKRNTFEKIQEFLYCLTLSPKKKKDFKMRQAICDKIVQIQDFRSINYRTKFNGKNEPKPFFPFPLIARPLRMIASIKKQKVGNCMEDAVLTNIVLKLNGVKNAARIHLFNRDYGEEKLIDHAVCIVNPPNIPLQQGKLHPKSIIIDSWSGKCDFADNMITYYRNLKEKYFPVNKLKDIVYEPILEDGLTSDILAKIKQDYPQLIFPNKDRKFLDLK